MKAVLVVVALAGCNNENWCQTVEQTGPGMSGLATYTLADGTRIETDLGMRTFKDVRTDGFEIENRLKDQWGIERAFTVNIAATTPGTYALGDIAASVCMVRQSGGSAICSPLTGTLELRAHERDCVVYEIGLGSCADTLDFTIAGRSIWETTVFTIDGEMRTEGMWVDDPNSCPD